MTDQTTSQAEYEAALEAAKRRHPSSYAGSPKRRAPVAAESRFATNFARHDAQEVASVA